MRPSIFYGVQFAQSRMLLLSQSGRISEIDGLLCPGAEVMPDRTGPAGRWHNHLPATQYIHPDDGSGVIRASWTTIGAVVSAVETEDAAGQALRYVVGTYDNLFALDEGVWKFRRLSWRPLLQTTSWMLAPDAHLEQHLADPRAWVSVPPAMRAVSDDGASAQTLLTLELRNALMGFCHRVNERGLSVLMEAGISASASAAAQRMLASTANGAAGFILATSPVVSVRRDLLSADVFASVSVVAPRDSGRVEHQRGSVLVEYSRADEKSPWLMEDLTWYRYATLEPWTVDAAATASKGTIS